MSLDKAREREIERAIANVDAAGVAGADRDGAATIMAKGLTDGLRSLLDMVKGKKAPMMPPPEEDDEPAEGAQGGDEPDDEPDEPAQPAGKPGKPNAGGAGAAGGGGGFSDMRMGSEGGEDMVDATNYILSLEKAVRDLTALNVDLVKLVKGHRARVDAQFGALNDRVTELGAGMATTLAPLAKGVVEMHAALGRLPGGGVTSPGIDGNRAAVRHALTNANPNPQVTPERLLKAVAKRMISDNDLTIWRRTGRLSDDDARNSALIDEISKL